MKNTATRARSRFAGIVVILLLATRAHAEPIRTPVTDARPVLLAALQSTDGAAHGVLIGKVADAITRHFQATSPIYIDVSTVKRYRETGCSRLKVLFWQAGLRLR